MSQTEQVKAFFDQTQRYLKKSFGVRVRALIARRMLGDVQHKKILDIGCGDGSISLQYIGNDNRLVLLDLSDKMLALAKSNVPAGLTESVRLLNQDFLAYNPDESFDILLCFGVLAHIVDLNAAMAQIASLLRDGGIGLVQFTDQERWGAKVEAFTYTLHRRWKDTYHYSVNLMTYSGVMALIVQNGLQVIDETRYSLLFPGMGRLPDSWLYRYQIFTLENAWAARHGSEVVLKLEKARK